MSRNFCVAFTAAILGFASISAAQTGTYQTGTYYVASQPAGCGPTGAVNWNSYVPVPAQAPCAPAELGGLLPQDAALGGYGAVNYDPCPPTAYPAATAAPGACIAPPTVYWNASAGALFLTRKAQDSYSFSYDSANEANQFVDAADADMDFSPGVEATIGRFDFCSNVGWQLSYWQLMPDSQMTQYLGSALGAGSLDGIRNYDQLDYTGGGAGDAASAADNVNNAAIHRLTRDWEVYNVEGNRIVMFSQGCGRSPWRFQSLCGFRYFKFKESLQFVSDPSETMIDGDADEYRIDVRTDNQLYGFQLGGITERCMSPRFSWRFLAKAGLFGNHAEMDYFEGGTAGAATINNGPNAGQMMRVHASEDDIAFLGEIGVGFAYRMGCYWRLGADYRVIGASGLALPTDQIYFDTRGINDVRQLDNDGSLLLHGAFVRLERCF